MSISCGISYPASLDEAIITCFPYIKMTSVAPQAASLQRTPRFQGSAVDITLQATSNHLVPFMDYAMVQGHESGDALRNRETRQQHNTSPGTPQASHFSLSQASASPGSTTPLAPTHAYSVGHQGGSLETSNVSQSNSIWLDNRLLQSPYTSPSLQRSVPNYTATNSSHGSPSTGPAALTTETTLDSSQPSSRNRSHLLDSHPQPSLSSNDRPPDFQRPLASYNSRLPDGGQAEGARRLPTEFALQFGHFADLITISSYGVLSRVPPFTLDWMFRRTMTFSSLLVQAELAACLLDRAAGGSKEPFPTFIHVEKEIHLPLTYFSVPYPDGSGSILAAFGNESHGIAKVEAYGTDGSFLLRMVSPPHTHFEPAGSTSHPAPSIAAQDASRSLGLRDTTTPPSSNPLPHHSQPFYRPRHGPDVISVFGDRASPSSSSDTYSSCPSSMVDETSAISTPDFQTEGHPSQSNAEFVLVSATDAQLGRSYRGTENKRPCAVDDCESQQPKAKKARVEY
ncbi:hypothetical protein DL96DRAFT_1810715 [Flagelloscypha sp. PMI_526]|nr:hypothetical protein DL96DRAFT_1810715 [Flagelloscypha sp. PMI_526]